jgi:uncharacterized membrane protein YfhO
MVTSEPMYPGWEATVNGKPVPLRMTNGAFRGLALPSGTNEIVMEYHPPYLRLYLVVSMAFLLLASGVALFGPQFFPTALVPNRTVSTQPPKGTRPR